MADIFEEVEEGLRQDRASRLWKKYGIFAYIAAGLIIGGVALYEYLQYSNSKTVEENAIVFEQATQALSEQNYDAAAAGFEDVVERDTRIAPMAANYLAEARLSGNADKAAAIAALEKVAGEGTPIGKLSRLKVAYLQSETMSRTETETYLGAMLDEESQFGALALELVAAKAVAEGDVEYARTVFNELRFLANVPPGVQQRARAALAALPPAAEEEDTSPAGEEAAAVDPGAETETGESDGDE